MRIYVNGYAYQAEKPFRVGNREKQERARVVERQREFNRLLKLSPPEFLGAFCRRSGISER